MADLNGFSRVTGDNMTAELNSTGFPTVEERYPGVKLYERFDPETMWFGRVLLIVWLVVGLPGNALSAKVWLEKRMRNSSAIYIAALSINCLVFLVLHAISALKFMWGMEFYQYPVVCELFNVFHIMPQYLNQLLILGFTVDRYIAVCFPLQRRVFCRPSRAVKVVIGMIIGSALFASVFYYYRPYDPSKNKCVDRDETTLMYVWKSVTEILWSIVGPIVTLVLNALVIHGVRNARRARRQRERQQLGTGNGTEATTGTSAVVKVSCSPSNAATMSSKLQQQQQQQKQPAKTATTAMLLTVSFVYVITTLPAALLFMVYHDYPWGPVQLSDVEIAVDPVWSRHFAFHQIEVIVYELSVAHYVVNLFIFLPTGRHFREAIVDFLMCRRSKATTAI